MSINKADLIEGMVRGMAVLESFDTERQRLNATTAAQRANITRAAARRHLLTLLHLGYLETDGRYFWLAPRVLRLSGSYLSSARLPKVLQPTLNRLAAQTQEAFSAVVLDGDEVVIVARSGSEWRTALSTANSLMRVSAYGLHLGARLPVHATSTGRVLLAAQTSSMLNAWFRGKNLLKLTQYTITEHKKLKEEISKIRLNDFALVSQEHELGVHALAVPLRTMQGATVAALNVVTSSQHVAAAIFQKDLLPVLQEAARELRSVL